MAKGFRIHDINDDLFSEILTKINPDAALKSWKPLKIDKFGYATTIVSQKIKDEETGTCSEAKTQEKCEKENKRLIGMFLYELEYTTPNCDDVFKKKILLKSKARSYEIHQSFAKLIPDSENEFLKLFTKYANNLEIANTDYKELEAVGINDDETLTWIMPKVYWSKFIPDQDIFVFAMEYLDPDSISHMFTVNDIQVWKEDDILSFLEGLSFFHAGFYNETNRLPASLRKYIDVSYKEKVLDAVPFWEACINRNLDTGTWTSRQKELGQMIIRNLAAICDILDSTPRTFIHGDINLMNECLRKDAKDGMPTLCLFDWEICSLAAPQHDVVSFLATMFPQQEEIHKWHFYIENYFYRKLETKGTKLEFVDFQKVFDMCVCVEYIGKYNWCCAVVVPVYKPPAMLRLMSNLEVYVEHVMQKYNLK